MPTTQEKLLAAVMEQRQRQQAKLDAVEQAKDAKRRAITAAREAAQRQREAEERAVATATLASAVPV